MRKALYPPTNVDTCNSGDVCLSEQSTYCALDSLRFVMPLLCYQGRRRNEMTTTKWWVILDVYLPKIGPAALCQAGLGVYSAATAVSLTACCSVHSWFIHAVFRRGAWKPCECHCGQLDGDWQGPAQHTGLECCLQNHRGRPHRQVLCAHWSDH